MALNLDPEGFLIDLNTWDHTVALELAAMDNLILTDKHWAIILFLREFYSTYKTSPSIRTLINTLKEHNNIVITSIELHQLFPAGAAKQANKIAGLPKPIRCI